MTDEHRLFRWLWRFNAVVISVAGAIVILLGLFAFAELARDSLRRVDLRGAARTDAQPTTGGDGAPAVSETVRIGAFSAVPGTPLLHAAVDTAQSYDLGYSGKTAHATRNLILFDTRDGTARRLLPDDRAVVSSYTFLPSAKRDGAAHRATSVLVTFHPRDSDGDGLVDAADAADIVLFPLGGGTRLDVFLGARGARGAVEAEDGLAYVFADDGKDVRFVAVDPIASAKRREGTVDPKP